MKTIYLHGRLGQKFGKVWNLDVKSPGEAIRAIESLKGGLFDYLLAGDKRGVMYRVVIGSENLSDPAELIHEFEDDVKEFHFYPLPRGSGGKGGGLLAILGAIIFVAAVWFSGGLAAAGGWGAFGTAANATLAGTYGGFGAFFATMGLSMAIGGVYQMLVGSPKITLQTPEEKQSSYYFSGAVNISRQGGPIPLGYGQMIIGSQVISLAVRTERIGVTNPATVANPPQTGVGGGGGGNPDEGGGVLPGGGGIGASGHGWTLYPNIINEEPIVQVSEYLH